MLLTSPLLCSARFNSFVGVSCVCFLTKLLHMRKRDRSKLWMQIVPEVLGEMLQDKDAKKSEWVMKSMLQMKSIDIRSLKQTYAR